jgi:hypothetical protein
VVSSEKSAPAPKEAAPLKKQSKKIVDMRAKAQETLARAEEREAGVRRIGSLLASVPLGTVAVEGAPSEEVSVYAPPKQLMASLLQEEEAFKVLNANWGWNGAVPLKYLM